MKKLIVVAMAALMSLAIAAPAFATESSADPLSFTDVPQGSWYESWVAQASSMGYMSGKGAETFDPEGKLTRAEAITVIYRAATGATAQDPVATTNTTGLPDVEAGAFYTAAANWAVENGVMSGRILPDGSAIFDPNALITRQDLATIIGRYAENCGTVRLATNPSAFYAAKDCWDVADYAREPMYWTAYRNILAGSTAADGNVYLQPTQPATRAQMAKIIVQTMRWIPEQIEVVDSGFSVTRLAYSDSEDRVDYAFIAENPNSDFSTSGMAAYSVSFYSADGSFIASNNGYIGRGFRPNDTCAGAASVNIPKGATPARMEITVTPNSLNWQDGFYEKSLSNSCFEILSATESTDDFGGTTIMGSYKNLSNVTRSFQEIVIIYRNDGKIVGGKWTDSGLTLSPGGIGTFDTYVLSDVPEHDEIEVYVHA